MLFGNTRSVINSLLKDLKAIKKVFDIIYQIILLLVCCFYVYISINNVVRIVIYSLILALTLFWVIFEIVYKPKENNDDKNKINDTSLGIKVLKLISALILIIYSIVDNAIVGFTDSSMIALIISIAAFILRILFVVLIQWITKYVSLFELALSKDVPIMFKDNREKLMNPLYGILDKFTDKDSNEENDQLNQTLNEMKDEFKQEYKEDNANRKVNRKNVINKGFEQIKSILENKKNEKFSK